MITDDSSLLRQYLNEGSDAAFGELVRRHIDLVYSAALRQVGGDGHRAQDVTQAVFCELARNAPRLVGHCALSGWLYTTARFIGARWQRAETRRNVREQISQAMSEIPKEPAADPVWNELSLVLDEAMGALNQRDRSAIVLRFFEGKPLADVGIGLGLTENAARMRVDRALEKLRRLLAKRGIRSTASVLGTVLAANAVVPAPVGLASTLVGPALAGAFGGAGAVSGLTLSLLHVMNCTKITVGVSAVAMASVVGTYMGMNHANAQLRAEVAALKSHSTAAPNAPAQAAPESNGATEDQAQRRAEHAELMRLRGEVGVLRQTTNDLAQALRDKPQSSGLNEEQVLALGQSRAFRELMGSAKMNYLRGWFVACQAFAGQNAGTMPETLEQATPYLDLPKGWEWTGGLLTSHQFEIVYRGALDRIEHPERTILVREKQPYDFLEPSGVRQARTYGFADGHMEVHVAPDGDFETWERDRMVASAR